MELSKHLLSSDMKDINYVMIDCNSVLAIFAKRSRRVSLGDVAARGPGLNEPRKP